MTFAADRWEFFQDRAEKWRWRRLSGNGVPLAECKEGHDSRDACERHASAMGWHATDEPRTGEGVEPRAQ